ncbi:hypothetical protein [Ideonella sp. BN130291]|uniref:hypothetical protein n=1 Tax=Ideonella sp. BN130291 TaxID=3112940 RepID=UPI002E273A84|nr:hypothetical protein [Ideonella sp. BN130291]
MNTLPASALLGVERLELPGGERMGLVGAGYVMELRPGWWLGPAVYGAATGRRGGLFTWGAEVQRRWRLGDSFGIAAGLYAGGGGGAAAPVGGGLMLRPHADFMFDFGGWQAGLSASHVRFPSGNIRSTQLGLQLMVEDRFAFAPPGHGGERVAFSGRGGIGADRMHPTAGVYTHRKDATGTLGYVGLRLEQQATPVLAATLEAAGAASGGADGYMEALAGLSAQWPVFGPSLRLGVRGAAGLAGGGAVHTGGGPIAKAAVVARWQPSPAYSVDLEAGQAKAFNGDFSARYAQLSLGMSLGDGSRGAAGREQQQTLHDMEWGFSLLHYGRAARKDGSERAMQLVALSFNRALSPHLYLSGQAHSAVAGGAGAYSVGLVGLGARTRIGEHWSAGAEALVGAAGGGGVASQGGAVAQPMAWVARDLGRYSRLKLGGGWIKSRSGALSSPVAQVTWSFEFGTP